jgi:phosphate uptake regulator
MKRRINLVGHNTLTVSLPSEFVKKQNLKKGQEIEVEEQGNNLLIRSEMKSDLSKKELDLTLIPNLERQFIDAIYKKGYDEVELKYSDKDQLEKIKKALNNELSTFEIINKTKDLCSIKSVSELEEKEFDNILKRTFILLKEMIDEIYDGLKEKDINKIKQATELEDINDKLTHLLRRSLNKRGYSEYKNILLLYSLIQSLEKIADDLKDFCKEISPKEIDYALPLVKDLKEIIYLFYNIFYSFNTEEINKINTKRKDLLKKVNNKNFLLNYYIISCCNKVYESIGIIISLRI